MPEHFIRANHRQFCYETFGSNANPPMLLIMGLGMQMISWPLPLCEQLAEAGFYVIRFDNRDVGLSDKESGVMPNPLKLAASSRLGLPVRTPYKLNDMAADTAGILGALGIEAAHLVGVSMGGMIAQLVAANYPNKALTLTSIMSTTGHPSLPQAKPKVMLQLLKRASANDGDAMLRQAVKTLTMISSPGFPPDPDLLRERILTGYARNFHPQGRARQMAAIAASGHRRKTLKRVSCPTLVIHGEEDVLVPVAGGVDTAKHIPHARLERIKGMGHDLPLALVPRFVDLITDNVRSANLAEAG